MNVCGRQSSSELHPPSSVLPSFPPAPRSILTDDCLRVKGSDGSIWALGDSATIDQPKVGGLMRCVKAGSSPRGLGRYR